MDKVWLQPYQMEEIALNSIQWLICNVVVQAIGKLIMLVSIILVTNLLSMLLHHKLVLRFQDKLFGTSWSNTNSFSFLCSLFLVFSNASLEEKCYLQLFLLLELSSPSLLSLFSCLPSLFNMTLQQWLNLCFL